MSERIRGSYDDALAIQIDVTRRILYYFTWQTRRNIRVVFDSDPLASLCKT